MSKSINNNVAKKHTPINVLQIIDSLNVRRAESLLKNFALENKLTHVKIITITFFIIFLLNLVTGMAFTDRFLYFLILYIIGTHTVIESQITKKGVNIKC